MILADKIRNYVRNELIEPARLSGQTVLHINAGEVHAALGLKNRMPAVCSALDAEKFLVYANVILESRKGPNQGGSVEWVFDLLPPRK
jgi:5-methylcytosine-specific restriction protein B